MTAVALVVGATGLVGQALTQQLLLDPTYSQVKTFTRRPLDITHNKLVSHIIDFAHIDEWHKLMVGDVLFSALGTTRRQAGSKQAQYQVDFHYQLEVAQRAAAGGVGKYALVSAVGANPHSIIFYNRMKGELEAAIRRLSFKQILIAQPGILVGQRKQVRPGEQSAVVLMRMVRKIMPWLQPYAPIAADVVAQALRAGMVVLPKQRVTVCTNQALFALAKNGVV